MHAIDKGITKREHLGKCRPEQSRAICLSARIQLADWEMTAKSRLAVNKRVTGLAQATAVPITWWVFEWQSFSLKC